MKELHLTKLPIDSRSFIEWALERRYLIPPHGDGRGKPRDADPGYALHAFLTGLFGDKAPQPFCPPFLGQTGVGKGNAEVLGYSRAPHDHLNALAHCAEDHRLPAMIDWTAARTKPMPRIWPEGLLLRFDLRACPVSRRWAARPIVTNADRHDRKENVVFDNARGGEMDAFQLAVARAAEHGNPRMTRVEAYTAWLAQRLEPREGKPRAAALLTEATRPGEDGHKFQVRVVSYRSTRLLRRPVENGRRQARWLTRPDVRFSGLLKITDGKAFAKLLATGIGRHCSFGFGMLLMRPA